MPPDLLHAWVQKHATLPEHAYMGHCSSNRHCNSRHCITETAQGHIAAQFLSQTFKDTWCAAIHSTLPIRLQPGSCREVVEARYVI